MTWPETYSPSAVRAPSLLPRILFSLVLLGVGLALGLYGGLTVANRFANPLSAPYQSGVFTQHLQAGVYLVYAEPVSAVRETPTDLTVRAPNGTPVAVTAYSGSESQTRGGTTYSAYAQFRAPHAGTFDLELANSGPPRVIVAQTLVTVAKALLRPAIETVAGGLVFLVGFVVLVHSFTRRWWHLQDRRAAGYANAEWPQAAPAGGAEWYSPAAPGWDYPAGQPSPVPARTDASQPATPPPGGFT